jgi:hypothetical protein
MLRRFQRSIILIAAFAIINQLGQIIGISLGYSMLIALTILLFVTRVRFFIQQDFWLGMLLPSLILIAFLTLMNLIPEQFPISIDYFKPIVLLAMFPVFCFFIFCLLRNQNSPN